MNKTRRLMVLTLAAVLSLAGCAPGDDAESAGDESRDGMGSVEGMQDMGGMGDMAGMDGGSMDMMAGMRTHMEMMRGMSGDSVQSMLATHRQMMGNMIAQMNREMRDMNMAADASWTATVDSLRVDLTTMPDMDPAELQALMPGHNRRAMRLMEMHRTMMAGKQM
ncbi:MAG TPA: hypothetical protein VMN78_04335 [Longimicrobiales bacterium]|nr:hypothetical protein [Longimicrobiales bacterium]